MTTPVQPRFGTALGEATPRERKPTRSFSLDLADAARKRPRTKKPKAAPTLAPVVATALPVVTPVVKKHDAAAPATREVRAEPPGAPKPVAPRTPDHPDARPEPATPNANVLSAPVLPFVEARGEPAPAQAPVPVPAPAPEQTLLQLALIDPSLHADVRANVVHLALETEAAGALALEVRQRGDQTHVRVDGPASPLVAQRADELRKVLSSEGLSLGNFSSGERGADRERADPVEPRAAAPQPLPPRVRDPSSQRRHEGRIDVEA